MSKLLEKLRKRKLQIKMLIIINHNLSLNILEKALNNLEVRNQGAEKRQWRPKMLYIEVQK